MGHIEALDVAGGGVLQWRSCGEAFQALQALLRVLFAHAEFLAGRVAAALLDRRLTEGTVTSGAYLEFGEQTPPQEAQALSTWTHNCHGWDGPSRPRQNLRARQISELHSKGHGSPCLAKSAITCPGREVPKGAKCLSKHFYFCPRDSKQQTPTGKAAISKWHASISLLRFLCMHQRC